MFQNIFLAGFLVYSFTGFLFGFKNTHFKKNPYGLTNYFNFLGSFVWADAVIFGLFFTLVTLTSLILQNFILFALLYSLFWTIRSIGEAFYWFLEQFTDSHKNPEHTLRISKFFPRNSSWIAMQIFWQCVSVVSIFFSILFFNIFLKQL